MFIQVTSYHIPTIVKQTNTVKKKKKRTETNKTASLASLLGGDFGLCVGITSIPNEWCMQGLVGTQAAWNVPNRLHTKTLEQRIPTYVQSIDIKFKTIYMGNNFHTKMRLCCHFYPWNEKLVQVQLLIPPVPQLTSNRVNTAARLQQKKLVLTNESQTTMDQQPVTEIPLGYCSTPTFKIHFRTILKKLSTPKQVLYNQ